MDDLTPPHWGTSASIEQPSDRARKVAELKPCPFCGGQADFQEEHRNHWRVVCMRCGVRHTHLVAYEVDPRPKLVTAWNKRAITPPAADLTDEQWERIRDSAPKPGSPLTPITEDGFAPSTSDGFAELRKLAADQTFSNAFVGEACRLMFEAQSYAAIRPDALEATPPAAGDDALQAGEREAVIEEAYPDCRDPGCEACNATRAKKEPQP